MLINNINKITIGENEELFLPIIWIGKEKNLDYDINLAKIGASIKLLMLVLGNNNDSVKININISHDKPHTKSKVIVRGILNDSSQINFNGLVKIKEGSFLSDTWLAAHFLLTSDNAKGRAVPSLEILENDIKAGHATTVGRINESEIFYLMTRGISRIKAKQIIISGFLNSMLSEFPESKEKLEVLKLIKYAV